MQKALVEFWKYVEKLTNSCERYDDYYLLRFLWAREFDLKKTTEMFTEFFKWRLENDVDNSISVKSINARN